MSEERRRAFDTWTGYFKVYWPLVVTMFFAAGTYFKITFLVENLSSRVTVLEKEKKEEAALIASMQRQSDGQNGTIMVIDERTKRMADDIRELRTRK